VRTIRFNASVKVINLRLQALFHSDFVRRVGVLTGGTAFAQLLMVLALPVLTRLYTPEHFNMLAVYVSMLSILQVAASLRFEIAIPLPQKDSDAANILAISLCSTTAVASFVGFAVWLYPNQLVTLIEQPTLRPYMWMLPLGVWLGGSYASLQYWATRKKRFLGITRTRLSQSIGAIGTQLGFGWAGFTPFGLLFGHMVSNGTGSFGLARAALRNDRRELCAISWSEMFRVFKRYDRFPKYSTFEALANSAAVQVPVLIIAARAFGPEAGFLMLATRVIGAPMSLIGGAVAQVYLSEAPEKARSGTLGEFTGRVIAGLAKTGIGPLVFAGIVAPVVFPIIFGNEWQRAGVVVAWMTPWCIMQLLSSSVSMTLHVTGSQRTALALQVFGFIFRCGVVIGADHLLRDRIVEAYAVSGFLFYSLYLGVVAILSGIRFRQLARELGAAWIPITLWTIFALMVRGGVELLGIK